MRSCRGHDQRVTEKFQVELEDAKGPPDGWNRSAVRLLSTGIDKATNHDGMDTVNMTLSVVIFQK